MINHSKNQKGMALVVTLLALVLITAMVVEFSYGVYTGTQNLYNWRDSQRLSIMAKSGINVSQRLLPDLVNGENFSYPAMEFPVENPFDDFSGSVTVSIEDEASKFYINSLINQRGEKNEIPYNLFRRLLKVLSLNERIADRVLDWIDRDSTAEFPASEAGAKNSALLSVDELLLINGISREDYNILMPYVTVYGPKDNSLLVNINGAQKPVLMCLSEKIDDELAQRVIEHRKIAPFERKDYLQNVKGFGDSNIYNPISSYIDVKGTFFHLKATASSGGVKRIIETVLNISSGNIEYWKEY